jgi:alkaline phosphatase
VLAINQVLADFTKKGIELLDNPKGFFMMVEGGEDRLGLPRERRGRTRRSPSSSETTSAEA